MDNEYVVEKIIGKKTDKDGTLLYKVKWENYSNEESTWEPKENLKNVKYMIKEYEEKQEKIKPVKKEEVKKKIQKVIEDDDEASSEGEDEEKKKKEVDVIDHIGSRIPIGVLSMKPINDALYCLVKFIKKSTNKEYQKYVPSCDLKECHPKLLIAFYESKIKFVNK
jgi:hypothetical protein